MSIGPIGINLNEFLIKINNFSFKRIYLEQYEVLIELHLF